MEKKPKTFYKKFCKLSNVPIWPKFSETCKIVNFQLCEFLLNLFMGFFRILNFRVTRSLNISFFTTLKFKFWSSNDQGLYGRDFMAGTLTGTLAGTLWQRGSLKSETEISRLTRKCREKQLVWRGLKDVGSFSLKVTLTNGQSYRIQRHSETRRISKSEICRRRESSKPCEVQRKASH